MLVVLLLIIIAGIGVTVWRFNQNTTQDLTSSAQEEETTTPAAGGNSSCQVPDEVSNVSVDYPSCN